MDSQRTNEKHEPKLRISAKTKILQNEIIEDSQVFASNDSQYASNIVMQNDIDHESYSQQIITDTLITDSQIFVPFQLNTQTAIGNKVNSKEKVIRPKVVQKKKNLSKLSTSAQISQISDTQESIKKNETSVNKINLDSYSGNILLPTRIPDTNNNVDMLNNSQVEENKKKIEKINTNLSKNKIIQRDLKPNSQEISYRAHKVSEFIHASKLPHDFWDNLTKHRFWYEDIDIWD